MKVTPKMARVDRTLQQGQTIQPVKVQPVSTPTVQAQTIQLPTVQKPSAMQQLLADVQPEKWYKGDIPTSSEIGAQIYKMSLTDRAMANEWESAFKTLQADPTSAYYNPYTKGTNQAINELENLGFDMSGGVTQDWLNQNSWLKNYYRLGTGGTPLAPSSGSSKEQDAAYWYYKLLNAEDTTQKAETEWAALQEELQYWAGRTDRNYSDDEILGKINWSKYKTLAGMDEDKGRGLPTTLNRAVGYNQDNLLGVLWAARNKSTGNTFIDSVMSAMGEGNSWQDDAAIRAKLDPENPAYSPYSVGSSSALDDAALYFGAQKFDQQWLNAHVGIINGNDATAKKYYKQVFDAEMTTQKAETELAEMWGEVDNYLKFTSNPSMVLDGLLDSYPTLKKMEASLHNGELLATTRAIDFRLKDVEAEVNRRCQEKENAAKVNSFADSVGSVVGGKAGTGSEMDSTIQTARDKKISDAGIIIKDHGTDAEKMIFQTAYNYDFDSYVADIQSSIEAGQMTASQGYQYIQGIADDMAKRNYFSALGTVKPYEKLQAQAQALTDSLNGLNARLQMDAELMDWQDEAPYADYEAPYTTLDVNGQLYHVAAEFDRKTGRYVLREPQRIDDGQGGTWDDAAAQQAAAQWAASLPDFSQYAQYGEVAQLTGDDIRQIEEQKTQLSGQLSGLTDRLEQGKAAYEGGMARIRNIQKEQEVAREMAELAGNNAPEGSDLLSMMDYLYETGGQWEPTDYNDVQSLYDSAKAAGLKYNVIAEAAKSGKEAYENAIQNLEFALEYANEQGIALDENMQRNLDRRRAWYQTQVDQADWFLASSEKDYVDIMTRERESAIRQYKRDPTGLFGGPQGAVREAAKRLEQFNARGVDSYSESWMDPLDAEKILYLNATKGAEAAEKYYKYLEEGANYRAQQRVMEDVSEWTGSSFGAGLGMNIIASILAPAELIPAAAVLGSAVFGYELSPNDPVFAWTNVRKAVRETSKDAINETFRDKPVAKWLANMGYDIASSMGDNVANMLTFSGLGANIGNEFLQSAVTAAPMAVGAGAQSYQEAMLMGASKEQALAMAGASVFSEWITETIEVDNIYNAFVRGDDAAISTLKDLFMGNLRSVSSEAVGEAASEAIETGLDQLIKANMQGLDAEEWTDEDWKSFFGNVGYAALLGGISGGLFDITGNIARGNLRQAIDIQYVAKQNGVSPDTVVNEMTAKVDGIKQRLLYGEEITSPAPSEEEQLAALQERRARNKELNDLIANFDRNEPVQRTDITQAARAAQPGMVNPSELLAGEKNARIAQSLSPESQRNEQAALKRMEAARASMAQAQEALDRARAEVEQYQADQDDAAAAMRARDRAAAEAGMGRIEDQTDYDALRQAGADYQAEQDEAAERLRKRDQETRGQAAAEAERAREEAATAQREADRAQEEMEAAQAEFERLMEAQRRAQQEAETLQEDIAAAQAESQRLQEEQDSEAARMKGRDEAERNRAKAQGATGIEAAQAELEEARAEAERLLEEQQEAQAKLYRMQIEQAAAQVEAEQAREAYEAMMADEQAEAQRYQEEQDAEADRMRERDRLAREEAEQSGAEQETVSSEQDEDAADIQDRDRAAREQALAEAEAAWEAAQKEMEEAQAEAERIREENEAEAAAMRERDRIAREEAERDISDQEIYHSEQDEESEGLNARDRVTQAQAEAEGSTGLERIQAEQTAAQRESEAYQAEQDAAAAAMQERDRQAREQALLESEAAYQQALQEQAEAREAYETYIAAQDQAQKEADAEAEAAREQEQKALEEAQAEAARLQEEYETAQAAQQALEAQMQDEARKASEAGIEAYNAEMEAARGEAERLLEEQQAAWAEYDRLRAMQEDIAREGTTVREIDQQAVDNAYAEAERLNAEYEDAVARQQALEAQARQEAEQASEAGIDSSVAASQEAMDRANQGLEAQEDERAERRRQELQAAQEATEAARVAYEQAQAEAEERQRAFNESIAQQEEQAARKAADEQTQQTAEAEGEAEAERLRDEYERATDEAERLRTEYEAASAAMRESENAARAQAEAESDEAAVLRQQQMEEARRISELAAQMADDEAANRAMEANERNRRRKLSQRMAATLDAMEQLQGEAPSAANDQQWQQAVQDVKRIGNDLLRSAEYEEFGPSPQEVEDRRRLNNQVSALTNAMEAGTANQTAAIAGALSSFKQAGTELWHTANAAAKAAVQRFGGSKAVTMLRDVLIQAAQNHMNNAQALDAFMVGAIGDGQASAVLNEIDETGITEQDVERLEAAAAADQANPDLMAKIHQAVTDSRVGDKVRDAVANGALEVVEKARAAIETARQKMQAAQEATRVEQEKQAAMAQQLQAVAAEQQKDAGNTNLAGQINKLLAALKSQAQNVAKQLQKAADAAQELAAAQDAFAQAQEDALLPVREQAQADVAQEMQAEAEQQAAQEQQQQAEALAMAEQQQAAQETGNIARMNADAFIERYLGDDVTEEERQKVYGMFDRAQTENVETKTEPAQRNTTLIKQIGKKFGIEIAFGEVATGTGQRGNGYYDRSTNTLMLDDAATVGDAVNAVLGHELTHVAEESGNYETLASALLRIKYGNGIGSYREFVRRVENGRDNSQAASDVRARRDLYRRKLNQNSIDATYATQEIVADVMGEVLQGNEKLINQLAADEPSTAQKILTSIKNFLKRLVGIKGQWQDDYQRVVGMLETALKDHAKNTASQTKPGKTGTVYTNDNTPVPYHYEMVDLNDLTTSNTETFEPNPYYPAELQPRDRSRAANREQVESIARNLNPARLGESADVQSGAPIVGPDGIVESGNGRVMAIRQAMQTRSREGAAYTDWPRKNAANFGLNPNEVTDNSVLVRVREGDMDRAAFAQAANESTVAAYSDSEAAASDAQKITEGMMEMFAPSESGKLDTADNYRFARAFIEDVVPAAERGQYLQDNGEISQRGWSRIRNAVLQRAYGNNQIVQLVSESTGTEGKNVLNALIQAAPRIMEMTRDAEQGAIFDIQLGQEIAKGAERYLELKNAGEDVRNYLMHGGGLGDVFTDSEATQQILWTLDENKRSARKIADALNGIVDQLYETGDPRQVSLIGETTAPDLASVIREGATRENSLVKYSLQDGEVTLPAMNIDRAYAFKSDEAGIEAAEQKINDQMETLRNIIHSDGFNGLQITNQHGGTEILTPSIRKGVQWQLSYYGPDGVANMHENYGQTSEDHVQEAIHSEDDLLRHFVNMTFDSPLTIETLTDDKRYSLPSDDTLESMIRQYIDNGGMLAETDIFPGFNPNRRGESYVNQRQFGSKTAQNSNALTEQVKDYLAVNSDYDTDTNGAQIRRAIDWIGQHATATDPSGYYGAVREAISPDFNYFSADGQAQMLALISLAAKSGDVAVETELAAAYNKQGTNIAQALQARQIFQLMSPEGRRNTLIKMQEDVNGWFADEGKDIRIELPEQMLEDAANAKTPEDFEKVKRQANQYIGEHTPSNWRDRLRTFRYFSMLFNPVTHIRNILGNAGFMPAVALKNKIGAIVEMGKPEGQRTKALGPASQDAKDFAKQDAQTMRDTLTGQAKYNDDTQQERAQKPFGDSWLQKLIDWNSNLLEREDWVFLQRHYRNALAGWMTANNVTGADLEENPEMLAQARAYAVEEAQKATYRDPSKTATKLTEMAREGTPLGIFFDAVLPFKKTPINVMKRGVEYSPLGLAKTIIMDSGKVARYNQWVEGGMKGKQPPNSITPQQYIDRIAAGLSGSAIAALGAALAAAGALKVDLGDEDEIEKQNGRQKYSLNIELFGYDVSYTVDWLAPSSMPLFVGASIANTIKNWEGGKGLMGNIGHVADAFLEITEPVFNLSMLDGINSLLTTYGRSESGNTITEIGENALSSYVTSFMPTILGKAAKIADRTRRETFIESGVSGFEAFLSRIGQKILAKTPGGSYLLKPYVSPLGETEESSIVGAALQNFISPGYFKTVDLSEMEQELDRLYKATGEKSAIPKQPAKFFQAGGENITMDAGQYAQLQQVRGTIARDILTQVVESDEYKAYGDDARIKMINDAWTIATQTAKQEITPDAHMDKWVAAAQNNPLQAIVERRQEEAKAEYTAQHKAGLFQSINDGDLETALTCIEGMKNGGKTKSAIKSAVTTEFKPKYLEALQNGDDETAIKIEMMLLALDELGYERSEFKDWWKKAVEEND